MEAIKTGKAKMDFMQPDDSVRIELLDYDGNSVVGAIEQVVAK